MTLVVAFEPDDVVVMTMLDDPVEHLFVLNTTVEIVAAEDIEGLWVKWENCVGEGVKAAVDVTNDFDGVVFISEV